MSNMAQHTIPWSLKLNPVPSYLCKKLTSDPHASSMRSSWMNERLHLYAIILSHPTFSLNTWTSIVCFNVTITTYNL